MSRQPIAHTPLSVSAANTGAASTAVTGQVFGQQLSHELHLTGVVFAVSGSGAPSLNVGIDYGAFRDAAGGGWTTRLRLVELPACALTSPNLPACESVTPLRATDDIRDTTLLANLQTGSAPLDSREVAPSARTPASVAAPGSTSPMVIAVESGPSGSNGSFQVTSLGPSGTWSSSGASGDFTWSYPITLPPVAAGGDVQPKLSLSYDSGVVDGLDATSNTQASSIGEGWDDNPGYIERSYSSCSNTPKYAEYQDLCWAGEQISFSLGARSGAIVRDDSTGTWHLQGDDGSTVSLQVAGKSGWTPGSGPYQGEYWVITTTAGVKYYFGLDNLPGGAPGPTNSTWTVPVYGPVKGNPCYSAQFAQSSCLQAWRWNLDYVVDPAGNAAAYRYAVEQGYYGADNATASVAYDRDGYLTEIDYGLRQEGTSIANGSNPPEKVAFSIAERCIPTGNFPCSPSQFNTANADYWPDTPQDLDCSNPATGGPVSACGIHAPTFWTRQRTTAITTSYWNGKSYQPVDSYSLGQDFAGTSDDPELHLGSITRTAYAPSGTALIFPAVSFAYQLMDNRVYGTNDQPQMMDYRLTQIDTETGDDISVFYSCTVSEESGPTDCQDNGQAAPLCTSSTLPTDPSQDTSECFPIKWTPLGYSKPITDYFHKYVVTEVVQQDGNATAPRQVTTYKYLGSPAWHYDDNPTVLAADESYGQWRGYGQVETMTGYTSNKSNGVADVLTQTTDTYMRGMNGDVLPSGVRSVNVTDSHGNSYSDNDQYADFLLESQTFDGAGGAEVSATLNTPTTVATTASQAETGLPTLTANIVGIAATRTYRDLAGGGTDLHEVDSSFDSIGRVVAQTDQGSDLSPACTSTTYAGSTSTGIRSMPAEVIKSGEVCPAQGTAPTPVLSDVRDYYDGSSTLGSIGSTGELTKVMTATATTGGTTNWAKTVNSYDTSGRLTSTTSYVSATDTTGRTTTTAYQPQDGGPLTSVTVTKTLSGASSQSTSTSLDPSRGETLSSTDVAGHVTSATYDPAGRIIAVWRPGQTQGSTPATDTYSYLYGPSAPLAVTTKRLVDPGNGQGGDGTTDTITTVDIYDAFGQLRQTQTDALTEETTNGAVDGVPGGIVVTDTFRDSHGWPVLTNNHWNTDGSPSTQLVAPVQQADIADSTRTTYDGDGRPVLAAEYSGTTATPGFTTQTVYSGNATTVIPPSGGTEQTTTTDPRGNTIEKDLWVTAPTINNGVVSGGSANKTTYHYSALSQKTGMTTAAGTSVAASWTWGYDLAGRMVTQSDPDTGTTTNAYDNVGDLTSTTDADGHTLAYSYDDLGRRTGEFNNSVNGTRLALWVYDTLQTGKLTSEATYTPGGIYSVAATGYDSAGNQLGTTTTVPSALGFASSYTTTSTWTSTGLLASQTPASDSSLPDETLLYGHDYFGDTTALNGFVSYISSSYYTPYLQVSQYAVGINNQSAWLTYTYDMQTFRTTGVQLSAETAIPQLENTTYRYDPSGNILETVDTQGGGNGAPVEADCYTYTALDRLAQAWSATDNCAANPTTNGSNATVGGAQPYWETWSFDPAGDRTQQDLHAVPGATGGDSVTSYTTNTSGHAHALTSTATTGPGAGSTSYGYDADGNTTSRNLPAGNQTVGYNTQAQLASVSTSQGTTSYVYDPDGNVLVREDPGSTTLYLPGEELTNVNRTITGTRYYSINGLAVAVRVGFTNADYLYSNLQGTTQTAVPTVISGTSTPIRRYFDPYGHPIASTTNGPWPDNHAFLNKPTDSTSGLDQLGAREYDPTIGRFTTVDPVLEDDPRQDNGYSYAANNPVTGSDPTGLVDQNPSDIPGSPITLQNDGESSLSHGRASSDNVPESRVDQGSSDEGASSDNQGPSTDLGLGTGPESSIEALTRLHDGLPPDRISPRGGTSWTALLLGGGLLVAAGGASAACELLTVGLCTPLAAGAIGGAASVAEELPGVTEDGSGLGAEAAGEIPGLSSAYKDVTIGNSIRNVATDVTPQQFGDNLSAEGWKITTSTSGRGATIYTKDGATYSVYGQSASTGGPTAQFIPRGATSPTLKIRLDN